MSDSVSKAPRFTRFPLTRTRVNRLTILTVAILVSGMLRGVAQFVAQNETAVVIDGVSYTPVPVALPVLFIQFAVLIAVCGAIIFGLRKHREWSRTFGTVIAAGAVLGGIAAAVGLDDNPLTIFTVLANVVMAGVGIVWIAVAWWNPESQKSAQAQ